MNEYLSLPINSQGVLLGAGCLVDALECAQPFPQEAVNATIITNNQRNPPPCFHASPSYNPSFLAIFSATNILSCET